MKKLYCIATLLFALCLSACQQANDESADVKGQRTLCFQITNYQQVSLDEVTRAEATTLAHLDMAIYQADDMQLVENQQTTTGNDGYGQFSATLDYGSYVIVFLGYDGSRTADMAVPTNIGFTDNYVPNFFYKTINLTISSSTSENQPVALKRAVAAFTLKHEGYTPTTLKQIKITGTGGGSRFNAMTGQATSKTDRNLLFNLSNYAGAESFGLTYYTFLTEEEATMNFTARATDTNNEELQMRQFTNVPMKINQRTIYSGSFFGSGNNILGFNLTLENDAWDEQKFTY